SADAVPAFFHRSVGQANDHHFHFPGARIDLDFDFVSVNAVDCGGINLGQHGGNRLAGGLQKIATPESGKCSIFRRQNAPNGVLANILRKFEQTTTEYCRYSEYLTLLSSFPDVKKSD